MAKAARSTTAHRSHRRRSDGAKRDTPTGTADAAREGPATAGACNAPLSETQTVPHALATSRRRSQTVKPEQIAVDLAVAQLRGLAGAAKSNSPQTEIQAAWAQLPAARRRDTLLSRQWVDLEFSLSSDPQRPTRPDALIIARADLTDAVFLGATQDSIGTSDSGRPLMRCYWRRSLLEAAIRDPDPKFPASAMPPREKLGEALEARKARLAAAMEALQAYEREQRQWARATGINAAEMAARIARQRRNGLERKIMVTPAQSVRDLQIKAQLVEGYARDPDRTNLFVWATLPGQLARSIRRDLPRILAKG